MTKGHIQLGKDGENLAVTFLKKKGYKILERNYKSKLGEIDIIAKEKRTICFIEVKIRTSDSKGSPLSSITKTKQRQIAKAALSYLKAYHLTNQDARFDVVSILLNSDSSQQIGRIGSMSISNGEMVELIRNAFLLDPRYTY